MARSIDPSRKTSREVQWQNETVPTGWSLRRGIHLGQPPWSGHQQAGHMEANDPIRQNPKLSCKTGPFSNRASFVKGFWSLAEDTVLSAVGTIRRNIWSEARVLQCPQRAGMR